MEIIKIDNLSDGRQKLIAKKDGVIIVNTSCCIRSYGVFASIYILEKLKEEFSIVTDFMLDHYENIPALITLLKMGYQDKILGDYKKYLK